VLIALARVIETGAEDAGVDEDEAALAGALAVVADPHPASTVAAITPTVRARFLPRNRPEKVHHD
jgi:hypothetical protein